MSDSVKQSPLGVNVLGSILQNIGLHVNPIFKGLIGTSAGYSATAGYTTGGPYTPGSLVNSTVLRLLTYAINAGYIGASGGGTLDNTTYNNLISIGSGSVPAFGNSKPPTYDWNQASGSTGVGDTWAPTGWGGSDQYTRTIPTNAPNAVTAWGFLRLLALQTQNEWNYNDSQPQYGDFLQSYLTLAGWADGINPTIIASTVASTYLDGVYSNINDMITGDIAGITLSTLLWGQDLIALGNGFDLSSIDTFGLPSNLLRNLKNNNAITNSLIVALLASGITTTTLNEIIDGSITPTAEIERDLYAAYTVITDEDLEDIKVTLNCKTAGLSSLADLLDPQKIFPRSYSSLTVPLYNSERGPTNSKTYYPIYVGDGINITLNSPTITSKVPPEPIVLSASQNDIETSGSNVAVALETIREATKPISQSKDVITGLTSYNPIVTVQQSTTNSVIVPTPRVVNIDSPESIASGRASSPTRKGPGQ